ncbi:GNAT family N-acetyltransferase [Methylobacterium indicum]|uniref:GNAT family N-acetyltransferase n=1 Tax=Methylobacterium indicum TaxID=1775910 RepID=UPI000B302467|nr:GNAT family N-acetyltransferase [Methylobacterium indicum]
MGVVIRPAVAEDVSDLAILNRLVQEAHVRAEPAYFRADYRHEQVEGFFRRLLLAENFTVLLAKISDISIGYLWFETQVRPDNIFKFSLRRIYIHHIAVSEGAQRKGVGVALVRAVEAEAEARGIAHVAVDTWSFNANAQAFFQRLGFEPFNIAMRKVLPGSA